MFVQWGDETPPAEKAETQASAESESSVEEETAEPETGAEEPVTE